MGVENRFRRPGLLRLAGEGELNVKRVGTSVLLCDIPSGAKVLGVTEPGFRDALSLLDIPLVTLDKKDYFNLYALERALFVGTTYANGKWVFGKERPNLPKLWPAKVFYEMGVASLTYSAATRAELAKRVADVAKIIRRRFSRKTT